MQPEKIVLRVIEKSVNHFLTYALSEAQIKPLSGKVIQMELNEFPFIFYWQFHDNSISILEDYQEQPDAVIEGSFFSLFKLMKDDRAVFLGDKVHIKGDVHLAEEVRKILSHIDFDYERYFAQWLGETPAHFIATGVRQTANQVKHLQQRFKENLADYLKTEAQLLPQTEEFTVFSQTVMETQMRLDRLEARIARILKHLEQTEEKHV